MCELPRGIRDPYEEFRSFVFEHSERLVELLRTKTTQTNEVGRCAALLPALCAIDGPVSLVEVGTSAGLQLLMDRYAYDYGSAGSVGESSLVLRAEARGGVPVPDRLPEVVFRKGIDIAPVDVRDAEQVRWLEACVWADNEDRLTTLRAAIEIARADPPEIVQGDLVDEIERVLDEALRGRRPWCSTRPSWCIWMTIGETSSPRSWRSVTSCGYRTKRRGSSDPCAGATGRRRRAEICFYLGRNGSDLLAYSDAHGRWVEWL